MIGLLSDVRGASSFFVSSRSRHTRFSRDWSSDVCSSDLKWLPHFCESTPETVWGFYGLTPEQAQRGGLNPKMFNSFLDGSKPSIESAAVSNATGLAVPSDGLVYPPASVADIPFVTRPRSEGGVLEKKGMVEVISCLEPDGRVIPYDIRMGVWVTVEGD